jgi:ATP-binding cassette, subfamily C (CFTR/MRP), member 2
MIFYLFFSVTSLSLYALSTVSQLWVLLERLADVFKMEEFKKERKEDCALTECGITAKDAAFSWGFRVKEDQSNKKNFQVEVETVETPTLQNVNFDLKHDSLLMVAGKIGTGKTTLLFSIMEENRRMQGTLDIRGKIAYVE